MNRKILHLDLDAFFCAVEELHDPSLKSKAFAVGGRADQRGVVASCSYAARMFGVRSAMPMSRAKQLCPDLIVVSSRHGNYSEVSKKVMKAIEITPFIEKISIDEAFVDVTGIGEPIEKVAQDLQHKVNTQCQLPISIGGATNKLVAKIANDWGKSQKRSAEPPNTITIIPPGDEAKFLAPLPVQSLWGIGPKTAEKLAAIGITTIGGLAETSPASLEALLGRFGPELIDRAKGIDSRPIEMEHETKSTSNEVTFAKDVSDEAYLLNTLRALSEKVGGRLRKESLAGSTIQIKMRWADFSTITRQTTLLSVTNLDQEIYSAASMLFYENWPKGKPVRLIGVGVSNLGPPVYQLNLWDDDHQKEEKLLHAVDELRERFGRDIIKRAGQVIRKEKFDKPEESGE
ncbi:MAG: DNA polymerase IV [Brevefilum sp.]|nr:DNA polymerase IV [Brevefilum sp.]MDT8382050.1 DNA polymerase IV [Brevefilum sp.]MDW7754141.1 DNA polymerase IV [Brevefilum sp.]